MRRRLRRGCIGSPAEPGAPARARRPGLVGAPWRVRGGRRIEFTAKEFDLLRYLVAHTGEVVSRDQILNHVWGYEDFPNTRTVDNFVAKIRQKLEPSPRSPQHILTVHGAGYKFVAK